MVVCCVVFWALQLDMRRHSSGRGTLDVLGGSVPKVAPSLGKHQVGKILERDDNESR